MDRITNSKDVGKAISDYLSNGQAIVYRSPRLYPRTRTADGLLSVNVCLCGGQIGLEVSGIDPRERCSFFRHSLATEMLRRDRLCEKIGEVLRHRSPDTTRLYAKVDLPSLERLAMPWPGGEQ